MSKFIPNSFQVPNAVIDELMCVLSGAEFKCYMLVVRQTTGWNKQEDAVSISQMMEKCNLSNRKVIDACDKLVEMGLLTKSKGYRGMNVFSVNFDKISTCEESSPVSNCKMALSEQKNLTNLFGQVLVSLWGGVKRLTIPHWVCPMKLNYFAVYEYSKVVEWRIYTSLNSVLMRSIG